MYLFCESELSGSHKHLEVREGVECRRVCFGLAVSILLAKQSVPGQVPDVLSILFLQLSATCCTVFANDVEAGDKRTFLNDSPAGAIANSAANI